jgi:hypothetical protein
VKISAPAANLVFYSEGRQQATFVDPLLAALGEYEDLEIYYLTSDPTDPLLTNPLPRLSAFFIGAGSARIYLLNAIKSNVVVMTMPDMNSFHIKRSPHCSHYVYFHHSMVSTHMIYRQGAFDHYDSILCVGPHHIQEIRQWEERQGLPAKQLFEHGYAPLDSLLALASRAAPLEENPAGKLNVLLAPSWGPQGLMETRAEEVVRILLEAGHYVLVRPHPRTLQLSASCIRDLEKTFSGHRNFDMGLDVTKFDPLLQSHIMISDWSGVAMEFAFALERPVLFIDVPRKVNNPDYEAIDAIPLEASYREQIGAVLAPDKLADMPAVLDDLQRNTERYRSQIRDCRDRNIFNVGESAKAGARYVYEIARQH